MNILAFAASSSSKSINKALVTHACDLLENELIEGCATTTLDLNDFEMPIYSQDREEQDGIPQLAHDFYQAIGDADALLISYAEHNGSYSAAYKNIFDWMSRIDMRVYQDKPTIMLSTSPGRGGGANALRTGVESAPYFGNDLKASLSIPRFYDNFDLAEKKLTNEEISAELRQALSTIIPASISTPINEASKA